MHGRDALGSGSGKGDASKEYCMYATIRTYAGDSELGEELRRNQDSVRSQMSAVTGFQAYYFVALADGGSASFTVCDDQAGAEESTRVAAAWIADNLPGVSIAPPAVSAGEVIVAF
jgi:hypothetical protein